MNDNIHRKSERDCRQDRYANRIGSYSGNGTIHKRDTDTITEKIKKIMSSPLRYCISYMYNSTNYRSDQMIFSHRYDIHSNKPCSFRNTRMIASGRHNNARSRRPKNV